MASKKHYTVENIQYDTDGRKVELPTTLTIPVPEHIEDDEVEEFLSDEISNKTGYCHFGFSIK